MDICRGRTASRLLRCLGPRERRGVSIVIRKTMNAAVRPVMKSYARRCHSPLSSCGAVEVADRKEVMRPVQHKVSHLARASVSRNTAMASGFRNRKT
eukprot:4940765-Pyramimonas_sp.AAC.1